MSTTMDEKIFDRIRQDISGHDVVLYDFATLAPGIHVSGNVVCEEGAYIGTGTNILPRMRIGAWSIAGAGSLINADVSPDTTVVGVPAKIIETRRAGWQHT